jgi:hypothetical protein
MSNITVITKLRFLAGIAPVVLLIVGPLLAVAFSAFGNIPSMMADNEIAAIRYAQGIDVALYKMEWGRTQPDGAQIVLDQQRRFADLIDSAARHVFTADQRDKITALAQAAKPTLDALRTADPRDESINSRMRDLHSKVSDLLNADDAAIARFAANSQNQARQFIVLVLIACVLLPLVCYAVIWRLTQGIRDDLQAMRQNLEKFSQHTGQPPPAPELQEIDQELTRLGFPRPNPMLAQE